jgi:hypothetical protein
MTDAVPAPASPVATPSTPDEAIGNFARGFLQEIERDDDPDQHDESQPKPEATEVETPEAETPAPVEDTTFEYDLDGEKVNVSEKLKGRLMADKDYRQKTMALAESRRQLEALTANAQQTALQAQQMAPYFAQLNQMDSRAQQLHQALQSQELAQDPLTYNRVQGELAILLRNRDAYAQGLSQQTEQLSARQKAIQAQKLALDVPKLLEEFPEIAKPEVQQQLVKLAQDAGLPQEAIDYLNYSAAGAKIVAMAFRYQTMVKDQATSRAKLQEKVKGLPAASPSSRAPDKAAKDQQLTKQWQKGGGKMSDPTLDAILRSRLRGNST